MQSMSFPLFLTHVIIVLLALWGLISIAFAVIFPRDKDDDKATPASYVAWDTRSPKTSSLWAGTPYEQMMPFYQGETICSYKPKRSRELPKEGLVVIEDCVIRIECVAAVVRGAIVLTDGTRIEIDEQESRLIQEAFKALRLTFFQPPKDKANNPSSDER